MVVARGGCSFTDKILAAAAAGALGVVVINTDATTSPMQGDPAEAALIRIPSVMVSSAFGDALQAMGDLRRLSIVGRATAEEWAGDYR